MHIIDGVFAVIVLAGCLYGVIVGPFVALFSIVGVMCAGPLLYALHPYIFIHLPKYRTDLIAQLIYFPLGYLVLIFGFKALALKLDSYTKKLWPGGKRIWGGLIGSTLACFFYISIIILSYPFVHELTSYSFAESKLWKLADSLCSKKPEFYSRLKEVVSIDDFKKVVKSSSNTSIQVGSNDFQIIPGEEQNLDNLDDVEIDKILKDQEDAAVKQKLLYEFLQKYLARYMESESVMKRSSE